MPFVMSAIDFSVSSSSFTNSDQPSPRTIAPSGVPKPTVYTRTPRPATMRAASSGAGPMVLLPSLMRMIAPWSYEPGGTGSAAFMAGCFSANWLASRGLRMFSHLNSSACRSMPASGSKVAKRRVQRASGRGAALELEAVDRLEQGLAVGRGLLHDDGIAPECDEADAQVGRPCFDERLGSDLRRREAVGVDVVGAHAEGHVDREDHRLVNARAA